MLGHKRSSITSPRVLQDTTPRELKQTGFPNRTSLLVGRLPREAALTAGSISPSKSQSSGVMALDGHVYADGGLWANDIRVPIQWESVAAGRSRYR